MLSYFPSIDTRKRLWSVTYSAFCAVAGWSLALWLWVESGEPLGFPRNPGVSGWQLLAGAAMTLSLTVLPFRAQRGEALRMAVATMTGWLIGSASSPVVGSRSAHWVEDLSDTLLYFTPTYASVGAVLTVALYLFVIESD